jgi:hypothetical protein
MLLEEPAVTVPNVRCASAAEWLPPALGEVPAPPPPDRRVVAAALEAILKVADAAREAMEEGARLQVEHRRTEAGGQEIRIINHP